MQEGLSVTHLSHSSLQEMETDNKDATWNFGYSDNEGDTQPPISGMPYLQYLGLDGR